MSILEYLFKHSSQIMAILAKGNMAGGSHLIIELLNNNKITLERMLPELKQNDLFDDTVAVLKEQIPTSTPTLPTPNVGA
jgi:hypothetical protein